MQDSDKFNVRGRTWTANISAIQKPPILLTSYLNVHSRDLVKLMGSHSLK